MSVQVLLAGAMMDALGDIEAAVFDAPPVRAARPYAVIEEAVLSMGHQGSGRARRRAGGDAL